MIVVVVPVWRLNVDAHTTNALHSACRNAHSDLSFFLRVLASVRPLLSICAIRVSPLQRGNRSCPMAIDIIVGSSNGSKSSESPSQIDTNIILSNMSVTSHTITYLGIVHIPRMIAYIYRKV